MINHEYITQLVNHCKSNLKKDYCIDDFGFDDFDIVNFYLIDKTLNQSDYNLSILLPQRDVKRDFYVPSLLSVASSLFVKNYIHDKTEYSIGEIIQNHGRRFKIRYKADSLYRVQSEDDERTELILTDEQIRKYIVTTAELSPRQVKTKFNDYKKLFNLIFKVNYVPSKFTYKTVMILEKSEFLNSLKHTQSIGVDLRKAIPFQWVTKKGLKKHESEFIPIEPMIYLVPDYDTFREHLLNEIDNLDSVVFIGRNKYEPYMSSISYDLRRGNIPKVLFIGSSKVDKVSYNINLKTWEWTMPEIHHFNQIQGSTVELLTVKPYHFIQTINRFEKKVIEIDNNYLLDIKQLFRLKKILYSTVLPSESLRLAKQLEYIRHVYEKEIKSILTESFIAINESPDKYIAELNFLSGQIINSITLEKFRCLIQREKIDVLIVPELFKDTWIEDIKNGMFSSIFEKSKIYSFKDFQEKYKEFTTRKNVYFLSIFGFKDTPLDVLKVLFQIPNDYTFILYPEEKELAGKLINRSNNEIENQLNSKDRYALSTIQYPKYEKDEDISDIISRFYEHDHFDKVSYSYEPSESIEYEIVFCDGNKVVLEGSKTILLCQDKNIQRKEKVSNLIKGDKIRVYENTSKERLFEIALENDSKGELQEVVKNSILWKRCIKTYCENHQYMFFDIEGFLNELHQNGAKIKLPTLRKWLDPMDDVFFPSQVLNLNAIKETIKCDILNEKFNDILKSRKAYRSIMISLGRDLSDELLDYIISNKKKTGKMLEQFNEEQIDEFVNASAPLRTVERIEILDEDE